MTNYTADQIALQDYITAENAASKAWMDEVPGRMAGMFPGVDHWIADGINTVEQFSHLMAVESYINVYKSINNIKPRWMDFSDKSAAEVEAMTSKMVADDNAWELELAERDAHDLNDLAKSVGQDVDTIIRWQEQEKGERWM